MAHVGEVRVDAGHLLGRGVDVDLTLAVLVLVAHRSPLSLPAPSIAPASMRTVLLTVGKAKAPFTGADAHYLRLLDRYQPVELVEARNDDALVSRLPPQGRVAAIDARGRGMDSREWAAWLEERRLEARDLYLLVGGPRGLPEAAMERADEAISL